MRFYGNGGWGSGSWIIIIIIIILLFWTVGDNGIN